MSAKARPSSADRTRPGSGRPGSAKKTQQTPEQPQKTTGFDFSEGKTAKSWAEYILLLENDLLPQVIPEDDGKRREVMVQAIRHKLAELNTAIRARLLAKDQTRRDILKLTDQQYQFTVFKGDLLLKGGMDAWLKNEKAADDAVYEGVRKYLQSQEVENKMLRETLDRRRNLEESLQESPSKRATQRRGSVIDRMNVLEGIIKKQDVDINLLQIQIQEQNTKYVLLPKEDYLEIEKRLLPFVVNRRSARGTRTGSKQTTSMADGLRASVCNVVEQVEKLRGRVQQTSDTITTQEKDKEVSLKILEKDQTAEELREVILRKVNEWGEEKENMQSEIKSLRRNIDSLSAQNRGLMEALAKNQELEAEKKEAERQRRISCPQPTPRNAEEGIKKAAEKRQRRITVVGNAPKLSSVQLSLGGGGGGSATGMRVRKSSAPSRNGPIKANGYP